jgi:hypothetical protein
MEWSNNLSSFGKVSIEFGSTLDGHFGEEFEGAVELWD